MKRILAAGATIVVSRTFVVRTVLICGLLCLLPGLCQAQPFRFDLRAEPDVIPANGISTSSILVQVQETGGASISSSPMVRFATTQGSVESQARLSGGIARVLLRSSTTPGTAVVTAFIGAAREEITVEFTDDDAVSARFLQVSGPYVAYSGSNQIITASGRCSLEWGETRIESDVRLDVDLKSERVWAEGTSGQILIRHGNGAKAQELRGDRLFYDLRRRRGVMRRRDTALGPARQEFMDSDFKPLPGSAAASPPAPLAPADPTAAAITNDKPPSVKEQLAQTETSVTETPAAEPATQQPKIEPAAPVQPIIAPVEADGAVHLVRIADGFEAREPSGVRLTVPRSDAKIGDDTMVWTKPQDAAPTETGEATEAGKLTLALAERDKSQVEGGEGAAPAPVPDYSPLPSESPDDAPAEPPATDGAAPEKPLAPAVKAPVVLLEEPQPPQVDPKVGYWIASRRIRAFPHDKLQFEKATLFLNGAKFYSAPLYVVSLNGNFNPASDMVAFNSSGGLSLSVPYYYQASPAGTGSLYLLHSPRGGFSSGKPGFSLALDQQYFLNDNSQGRMQLDQLGRGDWNFKWQHKLQPSPTLGASFYVDMPRHRSPFLRTQVAKEFQQFQLGFEGFHSRPEDGGQATQGQFYARLRPRGLGSSGWSYSMAANAAYNRREEIVTRLGRPIGVPGSRPVRDSQSRNRISDLSQSLYASLQAPVFEPWKGARVDGSFFTTLFNNSEDKGFSPGMTLALRQGLGRTASVQLDYSYDRGRAAFGNSLTSHFLTGAMFWTPSEKLNASASFTRDIGAGGLYGAASLDYLISSKWRAGLFSDYSQFDAESFLNYGVTLGRAIGQREVTVNWDAQRGRFYFELSGFRS